MIRGAVVGGNVSKSRSPAIHAAAFKALGVAGTYDRHNVDPAGFRRLIERLGSEGYAYVNVTIPHKRAAAEMADSASPLVKTMAAANTLIFRRGRPDKTKDGKSGKEKIAVRAENTDGYGLVTALADAGVALQAGTKVVLLGSGGAAAGGLAALVATGAEVRLVARRPGVAQALRRRFSPRARARITVVPWNGPAVATALQGAAALVSSVPADVFADPAATLGLEALERTTAVLEMAYGDPTPLRQFVQSRTRRYQDGLPMLVHQAARAVELVLGDLPPTAPLMRAARRQPQPIPPRITVAEVR
jgi:shikimate dehydrogenase